MSKETLVFVIGCIVFLTPFLGVPGDYKKWLLITFGILLMMIGYSQRRQAFLSSFHLGEGERKADAFVENTQKLRDTVPMHSDSGSLV